MTTTLTSRHATSLPIAMRGPSKAGHGPSRAVYRPVSLSPPEASDSATTTSSADSGLPSFSHSTTSSGYPYGYGYGYGGSGGVGGNVAGVTGGGGYGGGEEDGAATPASASIDLMELLNDRLTSVFDPLPLDRSLATQAQTSGALNAKHRELLALQAHARQRLAASRTTFADGIKAAHQVTRDLASTQKKVSSLKAKTEKKYPAQYHLAKSRYPTPGDY
ncbi:MAG: hypothetical protein M1826_004468 [Phylliscum demangeonii]|nr:MAG: hypothetical protein M1826_004468 [Phylliscum demangeonii]